MEKQEINKLVNYSSVCLLVEKTIESMGNLYKADKVKLKTYIFNQVAKAAKKL